MCNNKFKLLYDDICRSTPSIRHEFVDGDFNKYVLVAYQPFLPITSMVGRVVQVRKESGMYGSDQVFLREFDGSVMLHENQGFFIIPDSFNYLLDEYFKLIEPESATYSIKGENKEAGFIIKSKFKEGDYTPMRAIKQELDIKFTELLNK